MSALDRYPVGEHADLRGRDTCETCASAKSERLYAREHRLCEHPQAVARWGRSVSAGIARDAVCRGKLWRRAC